MRKVITGCFFAMVAVTSANADWQNDGNSGSISVSGYTPVIYDSATDTYTNVESSDINDDGSFKLDPASPCAQDGVSCSWMSNPDVASLPNYTPSAVSPGAYNNYAFTVSDAMTGNSIDGGVNGIVMSNRNGDSTEMTSAGIKVNGRDVGSSLSEHDTAIAENKAKNDEQDDRLDDHNDRITANSEKNDEQDGRLDNVEAKNVQQDSAISSNKNAISATKSRLDNFRSAPGYSVEDWATDVDAKNVQQDTRLSMHDTLLSQYGAELASHGKKLSEHDKAIAISMAMPDTWLGDSKKFGIFGSVGGWGGETAVGFAAIGRIDKNWTINAGFGADTNFDQFGWKVGTGVQW